MTLIAYNTARHEDLRDVVSSIMQDSKDAVLTRFLDQNLAATDTTHKWANKKLKGYKTTLTTTVNSSATTIVVGSSAIFGVNNTSYIKINDEYMLVTAGVGTTSLTVTRAQLGSSATAHTAGDEIFFIELEEEGADASRDDSQSATKETNMTQIFRRELKLSGTSQAVDSVAGDNLLANQGREQLDQLMQKLRIAFINNSARYVDGDESIRQMAGLPYYITTRPDATGNLLSADMIDTDIETLLENGADPNRLVLMLPTKQVRHLNALKVARVSGGGMQQSDTTLRQNVDKYEFSDALVEVIRVPEMPKNQYILGDASKAKIVPLRNRSFRTQPLGQVGDSVRTLLIGEYTCEVMNGADAWVHRKNLGV